MVVIVVVIVAATVAVIVAVIVAATVVVIAAATVAATVVVIVAATVVVIVVVIVAATVVIVLKAAAVRVDIVAAIVGGIMAAGAIMTIAEVTTTIAISRRFVLSFINLEFEGPIFGPLPGALNE